MKTTQQWLDEYAKSHQNPTNKLIHWLCIPMIVVSSLGLLASVPMPWAVRHLNLATALIVFAVVFYGLLSVRLMLALAIGAVTCYLIALSLGQLWAPLWLSSLVIFVIAWAIQLYGHRIEGKKPSFFVDLQFLLIGPMWLFSHIYRRLGIAY